MGSKHTGSSGLDVVRKVRVGGDLKLKPATLMLLVVKASPGDHPRVEPVARDNLQAGILQLEDGHLPALILAGSAGGGGSE